MNPTDKRIFAIAAAFYRGYSVDKIWKMTNIDKWFLTQLQSIHHMEKQLTYVLDNLVSTDVSDRIAQNLHCIEYR